jgi:hypothetical protein
MIDVNFVTLAGAYRRLVLWFGAQLALQATQLGLRLARPQSEAAGVVDLLCTLGALVTIPALAYYGFKTARALASKVAWVWALAMVIPCVNVLSLLALSSRATQACAERGIPVGLLGPKQVTPNAH